MLFLQERPSRFFGTSRPVLVDGRLGLISEVASVAILMTYLKHWVRQHVADPLCPQAAFQNQPQFPRIDLGPDHDQCRARQDRYAELFELQICVSHELDIRGKIWK